MKTKFPCREMPTRHCPLVFEEPCGSRVCARFESDDETPWLPELSPKEEQSPLTSCPHDVIGAREGEVFCMNCGTNQTDDDLVGKTFEHNAEHNVYVLVPDARE